MRRTSPSLGHACMRMCDHASVAELLNLGPRRLQRVARRCAIHCDATQRRVRHTSTRSSAKMSPPTRTTVCGGTPHQETLTNPILPAFPPVARPSAWYVPCRAECRVHARKLATFMTAGGSVYMCIPHLQPTIAHATQHLAKMHARTHASCSCLLGCSCS